MLENTLNFFLGRVSSRNGDSGKGSKEDRNEPTQVAAISIPSNCVFDLKPRTPMSWKGHPHRHSCRALITRRLMTLGSLKPCALSH